MARIFISYAHIDNEPLIEGRAGWISNFHRVLEKRLTMLLGERPEIWRDRELQGNVFFDDSIGEAIDRATLFVPVITPRYVKSDYCQKELEQFLAIAERGAGIRIGDQSRIFKVLKTPIEIEQHPQPIKSMLGYQFYQLDPEKRTLREFAVDAPGESFRDRFMIVLDDLAQEIGVFIKKTQQAESEQASSGEAEKRDPGKAVYLASTTSDLREAHDAIRRELLEHGHRVLPDAVLPLEAEDFEDQVRSDLARCQLAIHLVGERYGFVPEDAVESSLRLQLDQAAARSAEAALERVIWMPPGLTSDDPRQTELIEFLKRDAGAQQGASLLSTSLEELKAVVFDRLEPKKAAAPEDSPAADEESGPLWVYLLFDPRDADHVVALEDSLWDRGFEVRTPLFDGDESEVREEHEENLRLCEVFILYYGHANERWLRKLLGDMKKARGFERSRPIRGKAVVLGEPANPRKARFRTHEATVIAGDETEGELAVFLDQMEAAG